MSLISVIVPVYNVENYLEQCIESILNQSFVNFELILINDGSTDASGEICECYAREEGRITLIHQENKGLSMARNKGIEVAMGEYLTFIDSDDSIHQEYLEILYRNLKKYQADVSIVNHQAVQEEEVQLETRIENHITVLDNLTAVNEIVEKSDTNMIIAWGKLYKKSLFKSIRYPAGKYHEDEFVTYKLLYKSKKIIVSDAPLYYYTQRKDSITGYPYSLKRLEKLEALKEAIDFFENHQEKELAIKARARYLLNSQIAYYRVKHELVDENQVLEELKEEYDAQYSIFLKTSEKLSVFQTIIFKFFSEAPNLYVWLVKRLFSVKELVKK